MQREHRHRRRVAGEPVEHRTSRFPTRTEQSRRHPRVDERHRRERGAEAFGRELEVEQARSPAAELLGHPHGGTAERRHRAPEVGIEAAGFLGVAHHRRRALLGEEDAERLDQLFLFVGEREIDHARQCVSRRSERWA